MDKVLFLLDYIHSIVIIKNGDEITFPSKRIDLGQIYSISNHKS